MKLSVKPVNFKPQTSNFKLQTNIMSDQNFKNHARFVPLYHYVTGLLVIAILGGSIVNLIHADAHTHYSAAIGIDIC